MAFVIYEISPNIMFEPRLYTMAIPMVVRKIRGTRKLFMVSIRMTRARATAMAT